jgi:ATP-dependent DNA ligase
MWPELMAHDLTIPLSLKPMEAEPVDDLPRGKGWLYEPKYDGFRCLAFRDGDKIDLQSKKQKSLNRFFPEVVAGLDTLKAEQFVLDGEIVIPGQSFETLQLRLHPAESRIADCRASSRHGWSCLTSWPTRAARWSPHLSRSGEKH